MDPASTDDVIDLLNGSIASAALGAALELGLFWLLDERPLDADQVSRVLDVPGRRCRYWLEMLTGSGLVDRAPAEEPDQVFPTYVPSAAARASILSTYGPDTWAFLAREARERSLFLGDLSRRLRGEPPAAEPREGYVTRMRRDPERARRFTRMLHEIHLPLADQLARHLEVGAARRLLDLGGGSGVMSAALLRKHPQLEAVVMDIEPVCVAGRELAAEQGLSDRLAFQPGDFLHDELPAGCDLVLECDVDVYGEDLFRRVGRALAPDGRLVIVDQLAPAEGVAPLGRLHWALEASLDDPDFAFPTAAEVRRLLEAAGLRVLSERALPPPPGAPPRFNGRSVIIEAAAGAVPGTDPMAGRRAADGP